MIRTLRAVVVAVTVGLLSTFFLAPAGAQASTYCDSLRNQIRVAKNDQITWTFRGLAATNQRDRDLAFQKAREAANRAKSLEAQYYVPCVLKGPGLKQTKPQPSNAGPQN